MNISLSPRDLGHIRGALSVAATEAPPLLADELDSLIARLALASAPGANGHLSLGDLSPGDLVAFKCFGFHYRAEVDVIYPIAPVKKGFRAKRYCQIGSEHRGGSYFSDPQEIRRINKL